MSSIRINRSSGVNSRTSALRGVVLPLETAAANIPVMSSASSSVFARMMEDLSSAGAERKTVMIDATYLKAHRTASSLRVKKGILDA